MQLTCKWKTLVVSKNEHYLQKLYKMWKGRSESAMNRDPSAPYAHLLFGYSIAFSST